MRLLICKIALWFMRHAFRWFVQPFHKTVAFLPGQTLLDRPLAELVGPFHESAHQAPRLQREVDRLGDEMRGMNNAFASQVEEIAKLQEQNQAMRRRLSERVTGPLSDES